MLLLILAAQLPVVVASQWRLSERKDPITDRAQIYAVVGNQQRYVAIGCDRGVDLRPVLIIRPDAYLGSNRRGILAGGRALTVRFDDKPPLVWRAEYQDDHVTEDQAGPVSSFIRDAAGSRKMVVRLLNHDADEIDLIFEFENDPRTIIDDAVKRCAPGERG